jgi:hypothetical protein
MIPTNIKTIIKKYPDINCSGRVMLCKGNGELIHEENYLSLSSLKRIISHEEITILKSRHKCTVIKAYIKSCCWNCKEVVEFVSTLTFRNS